jgi:hypothetical protein
MCQPGIMRKGVTSAAVIRAASSAQPLAALPDVADADKQCAATAGVLRNARALRDILVLPQ